MSAISTALRYRNRDLLNPVSVDDAIAGTESDYDRVLTDSISLADSPISTYSRREPPWIG